MKRSCVLGWIILSVCVAGPRAARAEVPALLPVHGFLTDAQGTPIDGAITVRFALYASETAPLPLYDEMQAVDVDQGYFSVQIGALRALDLAIFRANPNIVLGMSVDGDPEMTPRLSMGTTPFAAVARYADDAASLAGLDPGDFRLVTDPVDWSDVQNAPAEADPVFASSTAAAISGSDVTTWDTAYGWGDHATAGYLTSETDPSFSASPAATITSSDLTSWDTAYGWGDHATAGYALSSSLATVATSGSYTDLANRPAYAVGDRLIFAQDAEVGFLENNTTWTKMNETSAVQGGAVRIGFEAYIQSGPDWWAWRITIDGVQVMTGPFTLGLHPTSTASVHAYRRYELDVAGVSAGSRVAVWMKASDSTGGGFGSGGDQLLWMKRFRVYAATPSTEGGVYTAATFRGRAANAATIIAANTGYVQITAVENNSPDVFEVVGTGTYGVRFLRAGHVMWNYDQDLITGSAGWYAWVRSQVGQDPSLYTLMRPSSGFWDGIHNSGVAQVSPGDVLTFEVGCNSCDITAMDEVSWSNFSIMWMGHLDP